MTPCIAFSIIGVMAVAIHYAHKTKGFAESINGAPAAVKQLSTDLSAIEKPLHDLSSLCEDAQSFVPSTRDEAAK